MTTNADVLMRDTLRQLDSCAQTYPHFEELEEDMTRLIRAHGAPLDGAYRVAYYRRFDT